MVISLLAATLALTGGVTALTSAIGRDRRRKSLNASIVELQKNLGTTRTMVQQLAEEKAELGESLKAANDAANRWKSDLDEAYVHLRRLEAMHAHYTKLMVELRDLRDQNAQMRHVLADVAASGIPVAEIPRVTGRHTSVSLSEENQRLQAEIDRLTARGVLRPTTAPKGGDSKP
jgi:chromosome segregation ATPase